MDLKAFLEELFGRPVDLVIAEAIKPRLRGPIPEETVYVPGLAHLPPPPGAAADAGADA